jgi:enediyne biosynthesis protein E4
MKSYAIPVLILFMLSCSPDKKAADTEIERSVFQKVDSEQSGIHFANTIRENVATKENVFDYDYFYNGAGVGIADINNDGLSDIVFCGNQEPNKIYLNKGGLKFEDITAKANINVGKEWSNGVTFADVNNDGWLDIYISQGGPHPADKRKNLLFINQQDLTFKEEAGSYGLADAAISTQSGFFDFDRDGDLDCIVMNENPLYGLDPREFDRLFQDKALLHMSSSHLFRNDNGKFIDITEEAGLLKASFGLGLAISDINDDNWLDIYIANDYYLPDAIYLNQGDGTFADSVSSLTNHVSFAGMGIDIADINNDSHKDIFVLDMASADHYKSKTLMATMDVRSFDFYVNTMGYHYQYMFNSLQLNNGYNKFKNIAQYSGMAKTDWSWAVLMVDFNNDEHKDIFITNGYRRYATDNDTRQAVTLAKQVFKNKVPLDVKKRIYYSMPSEKLPNIMYENKGHLKYTDKAKDWGVGDLSFSNGAAYGDLDNDGDLELVVNNMDDEAFLYKNLTIENGQGNFLNVKATGNLSESFPRISVIYDGKKQVIESKRVRGYRSSVDNLVHFGVGENQSIDTVRVDWPSGKREEKYNVAVNKAILFDENNATFLPGTDSKDKATIFDRVGVASLGLNFKHQENDYDDFEKEKLLPYKQSTLGPSISQADVNGDGITDLYVGGAAGQRGQLFLGQDGKYTAVNNRSFQLDAKHEDMESVFFDADSDGDLDLFVVSGGNAFAQGSALYRDRLYINDGQGNFSKSADKFFDAFTHSGKTVCAVDYDNDNDMDLIVGNRIIPQHYPKAAPSYIFENDNGRFRDVTATVLPGLQSFGIINKIIHSDFDGDGWQDLVIVGEWTKIGLFKNNQGLFEDISARNNLDRDLGWWFSAKETDVNKDGLPDFVVGNVGLNTKYKASSETPFKVFANDFDGNGTFDIVLSTKYQGAYVPFRGKECSTDQMPFISDRFPTYDSFARASLTDIYGTGLDTAYQREATTFESFLLLNLGGDQFETISLPVAAQFFPVLDIETYDVNKDGYEDLLLVGAIYNTEVETPRFDAGSGLVLISDHKRGYVTRPALNAQFYVNDNVKSIEILKNQTTDDYAIIGINNNTLAAFRINREP